MQVSPISSYSSSMNPNFTSNKSSDKQIKKEQAKTIAVNALFSAGISGGLTLMLNKGKNYPLAGKVAALAAGISVLFDAVHNAIKGSKENKAKECAEPEHTRLSAHQG